MSNKTINEAIVDVLRKANKPMHPRDILAKILESGSYSFKTKTPEGVIRTQMRRHSENINLPASSVSKLYISRPDGSFELLKA